MVQTSSDMQAILVDLLSCLRQPNVLNSAVASLKCIETNANLLLSFILLRQTMSVCQTVLTCCTISSTLMVHLHLTILHNIQTQTTTVSLLQLVTGKCHAVMTDITLSVSLIITYLQV